MIPDESIPAVNYIDRIRDLLTHEDPRTSDEGIDAYALMRRASNPNVQFDSLRDSVAREQEAYGSVVTEHIIGTLLYGLEQPVGTPDQIVDMHNLAVNSLNPGQIVRYIQHGRCNRRSIDLQFDGDYQRIFPATGLSRRSQRRTPTAVDEIPDGLKVFVNDWLDLAVDIESPTSPAPEAMLPEDMQHFAIMVDLFMPARLDFKSWVGKQLLETHGYINQEPGLPNGYFAMLEPWMMADDGMGWARQADGTLTWTGIILGKRQNGCIVFVPRHGLQRPPSPEDMVRLTKILKRKEALEEALISLSRRIARYVVRVIMLVYVLPEFDGQRLMVNREQLGQAVEDILGAAWFDLPFDRKGTLRNWSVDEVLKPATQVVGSDVFLDE
ncbi:hypothetical protein LTR36_007597 [Oleoguttula mirabilis]|uniref:Uncharacterized protein n=1 Tax=Oleoguttula mirabilis TaxID=1507867 RepID=A0AAV9JU80_9PEZI|nr:hypothetical protein LTR36_007597 [Oleoguttula mirabilis]